MTQKPHPLRCETCKKNKINRCPIYHYNRFVVSMVGCASHSSAKSDEQAIRQDERNKVYDELGVLHGEDAKRFNEYMNKENERIDTPEGRKLIEKAHKLAKKTLHMHEGGAVLDDLTQWLNKHTWIERGSGIGVVTKYVLMEFIRELRTKER